MPGVQYPRRRANCTLCGIAISTRSAPGYDAFCPAHRQRMPSAAELAEIEQMDALPHPIREAERIILAWMRQA